MPGRKQQKKESVCEKCGGVLFLFTPTGIEPCECQREVYFQRRLSRAGIPPKYRNKSIDTFTAQDRVRKTLRNDALAYVNAFSPRPTDGSLMKGLMFMGGVGCGKTHLAIGILHDIIRKGYTGYYCNVVDLFMKMRDTYRGDVNYDEMDIIDRAVAPDLLVLDDIGAENTSDWSLDRLYNIINRRYENNRPIIVTTNYLNQEELAEQVGRRIVSRLCEMCQICDRFPKEDFRMRGMVT
ncbi:MAG TPA: ATP-binding protein [Candidatus Sumerlaeota bacterium]|nr:ATP-binding protein [Candidatus Sumerlaeota bacterium]